MIYVGTGHAGANMADWWRFDPANDTWTQMASMTAGRTEGTPMVLNGKGYIATGYTTVLDAELWEYTPPVSPPALNSVNNLAAFSTVVGTASANQSFTVNGTNLTTNVSITAPAPFEISLSSGSGFGTSLSLAPVSGNISTTTVYVRYNPATAGSHSGNISISSTGVSSISIPLSGTSTVPAPALSSNDNLSLFSTIVGTPSSEQQFDVTGANLTANVVLSAPTDFEISTTSGSGFSSGITLIPVGGNIPATTIYVRYNPASAGSHAGNLTITSTGASSLSIALTGSSSAVGSPAIIVSASLSAFATIAGTPSAQQTALVSGSNLTANIDLQAPSDFEISLTSGSAFGASLSLTPSAGTVANTTIYIRYNPALAGSHNGNLTAMSLGANPLTIALSGTSTNPVTPAITLTGTPTAFGTVVGTPSAEQTLVVSAVGLTANLDIQAPTEFEISFSSGTGFSSTLVLVSVAGDVPNTNIFIRYNPAAVGTHNGNLTASSTGLTTQTALLSGTSTLSAIAEVEGNYRLVFYPNPMKEKTTIEVQCASGMDKEQTHLRIFDGNGKEVMRNFDEVKTEMYGVIGFTIERHSLQAGLYHFQISYQNKVIAKGKIAMD